MSFAPRARHDPGHDGMTSMSWIENKRVVVTGATSGIGREVATALAAHGAEVVLACRDGARAAAVARDIATSTSRPAPEVLVVDTSDPRSIRSFADRYAAHHETLDVLVNNAGVLLPQRAVSAAGVELTFATNVLGYYLVTTELCDVLPAPPERIINVASTFAFALDLDDLQFQRRPYDGMAAYAQSKACNRLLTWALARRLGPQGVTVNAVAPGLVLETSLYRELAAEARRELEQYGPRPLDGAADTVVWLASSTGVDGVTGTFFERRSEMPCEFRDEENEERLWQACDRLTRNARSPNSDQFGDASTRSPHTVDSGSLGRVVARSPASPPNSSPAGARADAPEPVVLAPPSNTGASNLVLR